MIFAFCSFANSFKEPSLENRFTSPRGRFASVKCCIKRNSDLEVRVEFNHHYISKNVLMFNKFVVLEIFSVCDLCFRKVKNC